jgi:hypothetical protein
MRSHLIVAAMAIAWTVTTSIVSLAAPADGKWSGKAAPNIGTLSKCTPVMNWEWTLTNGKLAGKLEFVNDRGQSRVQPVEATVKDDGAFESGYLNPRGDQVNVTGKIGDTFTVHNPKDCGYGNIPLK